jgi:uncharacterized membrane protein YdjX (TVP38/TMEM64 family)
MNTRRIIALVIFAVIISAVIYVASMAQSVALGSIDTIGAYLEAHRILGIFIFFGISVLAVLVSPLSSVPIVPSATLAWGGLITLGLLVPAWMVGAVFAYYIGAYSREKIIRRFVSFEKVEYYKKRISPRTQFWLVLLFRIAVPSELAGYTLGIVRYDFKKYLLATFLVELPVALVVIYSSSFLLSGRLLIFSEIIIGAILVFYIAYLILKKQIEKK